MSTITLTPVQELTTFPLTIFFVEMTIILQRGLPHQLGYGCLSHLWHSTGREGHSLGGGSGARAVRGISDPARSWEIFES